MYEYNLGRSFERIAVANAQRPALWFDRCNTLSYGELNALANRIARLLLAQGVEPGQVVCISGTKTPLAFAAIIACLKIGAIYTILDPSSPVERLRKILATCRPRAMLAESALLESVPALEEFETVKICCDAEALGEQVAPVDPSNLDITSGVTSAQPAYIMFTSGSTGVPKGAVMTHANLLNLISWAQATYDIDRDDVAANVNPLFFDNSVFDLYSTLFSGARLVPFTKEEARDPRALVEKLDEAACTQWFSVPSLLIFLQTMKATDGRHLRSLRRFIFGGEGYPKAKLKQLYDVYSDSATFFNVYGPTECTCICSSYRLSPLDFEDLEGLPPLGRIADNFGYLILDDEGRRVPTGEPGELCLLGPNVGLGYYNDPERTSRSFAQNPLNTAFREIMYRTGDIVRFEPRDGKLYIQGRKDNQIKHMGYRIELEEIEAGLHCLPYVSEAVALHAVVRGLSRLSAVVALRDAVDDQRLRLDLSRILPEYMLPAVIHREASLPKNANGKVDRRGLHERYCSGID